jgi:hypothetical protein
MDKFLKVFVDDMNVHNMIWEEHLEHLWYVFMRLMEVNLKLNPRKWVFTKTSLVFLSHVVNRNGTHSYKKRFKPMNEFSVFTIVFNVCPFLGLTSYYISYVKGYSGCITILLVQLTKKDTTFN